MLVAGDTRDTIMLHALCKTVMAGQRKIQLRDGSTYAFAIASPSLLLQFPEAPYVNTSYTVVSACVKAAVDAHVNRAMTVAVLPATAPSGALMV